MGAMCFGGRSALLFLAAELACLVLSISPARVWSAPATAPAASDEEESEEQQSSDDTATQPAEPPDPENPNARTPQTGFSVRKEDAKVIDALEDFRRHSEKNAWELASRALATVAEKDPKGMVPAGGGMMMPTRRRIWLALATLSSDGREAYRLFNDAKAKQLFEKATAPDVQDELTPLRELFQLYFITSVGDKAADRLGDACFESGDFLAADAAWKAVLDYYPDSTLAKARLRLKRCAALARAGRWQDFDAVAAAIGADSSESMRLAGRDVPAAQFLATLRAGAAPQVQPAAQQ